MKHHLVLLSVSLSIAALAAGCTSDGPLLPDFDAANFSAPAVVDNPYMPLPVGTNWVHMAETQDGLEIIETAVFDETRTVLGVECAVVRDTVSVDGEVIEDTFDWYAQDDDGNVWYMGEETCEYENYECVEHAGEWEAGVDGAQPGYMMPADPQVGDHYYQEFYEGEAEDQGEILDLEASAQVAFGSYSGCIKIKDINPFEPDVEEHKYYCEGVGVVLEEKVKGGDERVELTHQWDQHPWTPQISAADFMPGQPIDNPYFPLPVGATWSYEVDSAEGHETIDVQVLAESKTVAFGVECVVVRDTVRLEGEVIEDTWDWYAQDLDGNVWYMGEDTCEFEDGECVSHAGAWEAGVDHAIPGIIMPGGPTVGFSYYQEYYVGRAEDMGEVLEIGLSESTVVGDFDDCVKIRDTQFLAPDYEAFATYCAGVGFVRSDEGSESELITAFEMP